MKILAVVRFNDGLAYVLDEEPELIYDYVECNNAAVTDWSAKIYGRLRLVGVDPTETFFDCMYRSVDSMFKAFGGRTLRLKMKSGEMQDFKDIWWDDTSTVLQQHLGLELRRITCRSIQKLQDCYVYTSYLVDLNRFAKLLEDYYATANTKVPFGYYEFEDEVIKPARELEVSAQELLENTY